MSTGAMPAGARRMAGTPPSAPPGDARGPDGAPPSSATGHPGEKPSAIDAAQGGRADDLKLIKGVGPKNEAALNALGVFHFSQIGDWSPRNADWVGHHMAFPGRIEREHWIDQAKLLAAGFETPHAAAIKAGTIVVSAAADEALSETEAAATGEGLPALAPKVDDEHRHPGARPLGLVAAPAGVVDDLKLIKGIGTQNEARLHALGIWQFAQIAAWTPDNIKWVGSYLAFPGRITREQWVAQSVKFTRGRTRP